MRQCLNELQKACCMKTKLDWQWWTLKFWCQMNCDGHSSPVMHKKLKITSGKSLLLWYFLWNIFSSPVRLYYNTTILHKCVILCWSCLHSNDNYLEVSLWFWVVGMKKKKKNNSIKFSKKIDFWELLWKSWIYNNVSPYINCV